ncbi:hypothetical protein ACJMK2_004405 [Sinanodonta woodiana]|uniref:Protein ABHD13 n=1 Tax=Sinanodonta woodiana TaxID=1069815 RepID=A0ABD3Y2H0_SINWO
MTAPKLNLKVDIDPNMARSSSSTLRTLELIYRIVLAIFVRFWKLCMSATLILLLIYWTQGGIVALVCFILAIFGIFYNAQDMFLYYPNQPPGSRLYVMSPDNFGMRHENHFITTKDGVSINVVLIKHPQHGAATIVYFHGNAGNIGHRLLIAQAIYLMCHVNILMVEYRGYGKSSGSATEKGLYFDSAASIDFLMQRKDIDLRKIFILGASLGGAVAIELATNPSYANKFAGLILENTFTSLPDIARNLFSIKILDYLPTLFFKNKFPSEVRIAKVNLPTLFLSGLDDELIPPRMMKSLYEASMWKSFKETSAFSRRDTQ